jgi:uncharacterized protein (TIGR02284 family)
MSTATAEIKDVVNNLIEVCHDGELGFAAASTAVSADEPLLKSELLQYSRQRREFSADLDSELQRTGEEPVTHGTVSGALHRGWMNLKQAIAANDRYSILAECERGEDAAVSAYRQALAAAMPGAIGDLVSTQFQAAKRVHDRVRALRDAAKPN